MNTKKMIRHEIHYRRPSLNEIDATQKLFNEIVDTSFSFPVHVFENYKKDWVKSKIEERLENLSNLLILAWQKEKPIALVFGFPPEGGVGTIIWMLVKAEYRNKKIGSALLFHASQFYKNLGCHKIKLTAPNEKAKNFYLKEGMTVEGFHPKHWWKMDFWSLGLAI